MKAYPHWMHTDHVGVRSFHFLIPKFHLTAHIMACQTIFLFNFNRYVGRTDGEAPECGWSQINAAAISTAEMGPGNRRDTLDDHFGDGNWQKTTRMGRSSLPLFLSY
jgi:Kyakuja-Dileera-Zisupton transposase